MPEMEQHIKDVAHCLPLAENIFARSYIILVGMVLRLDKRKKQMMRDLLRILWAEYKKTPPRGERYLDGERGMFEIRSGGNGLLPVTCFSVLALSVPVEMKF